MSQEWVSRRDQRWRMKCDTRGCLTTLPPTNTPRALGVLELAVEGWFIAEVFGDACPDCVADGKVDSDAKSLFPRLWEARQEELRASKDGRS